MWTNFIFQTITKHQHQYMCACWCLSVFLDVSQCVSQETWSKGIHWFDLCSFCSVWLVLLTHKLWKFQLFCQMLRLDTKWAYKIFKSKGCSIAFRGSWGYAWRTPQHHWPSQSLPWLLWSTGKKVWHTHPLADTSIITYILLGLIWCRIFLLINVLWESWSACWPNHLARNFGW